MRLPIILLLITAAMAASLAGCNPPPQALPASAGGTAEQPQPGDDEKPTPAVIITSTATRTLVPPIEQLPEEGITTVQPPPLTESSSGSGILVSQAIADLAQRLSIEVDLISVVEVKEVVWPDSSLGCPQPGMAYKQIPYDGALILLEAGGRTYEYHSGGSQGIFFCEQTLKIKETPFKLDPFAEPTPVSAGH